jgi:glycosyltransferase involved in cell wall biosynthesis
MGPKVTVWLPSYNHAPYLPAAIDSVLEQTLTEWELVLVEDGSADGSLEIAQRYGAAHPDRITVLTHPGHDNRGVEASATLAIAHARGRFLIGLASDDVLNPDSLEQEADYLERNPSVGFVYGYAEPIDEAGRPIASRRRFGIDLTRDGRALERLIQGNTIPSMTAMLRRECVEDAGQHDGALVYSDWEFFVRAAAHWDVGFIDRALAGYRFHQTNVSLNVSREANLERSFEVVAALRERAEEVGGGLTEPRIRATLDLQMAFLLFARGDDHRAADAVHEAFRRDPSLSQDARWLADWLWSRPLDRLLPLDGPRFSSWFATVATPCLAEQARGGFRRSAAGAEAVEDAVRLASAGRPAAVLSAVTRAVTRNPRRMTDRGLAALLLDSVAGTAPERIYRRAQRVIRRRYAPASLRKSE